MKTTQRMKHVIWLVCLSATLQINAEGKKTPKITGTIKGCTAVVGMRNLSVYYERVLVVAIKPTIDPETELPRDEYWVQYPDSPDRHADGKAVNIPQDEFIKDGTVVMRKMKVCKCPPFFWGTGGDSGFSAANR